MSKLFTYKDNLGSILKSSPKPFDSMSNVPIYEGFATITKNDTAGYQEFEDYISLDKSDYAIYSEKSKDTPYAKYTIISQHPESDSVQSQPDSDHIHIEGIEPISSNLYHNILTDTNEPVIKDVIVSKQFEESYMSTINRVYLGSLTIVGLYVLFRYLKE